MGKNSLTKSTSTKKSTQKDEKKKNAGASSENTPKKQTGKAKAALTDPLGRQFDSRAPEKAWKPKPDKTYEKNFAAPLAHENIDTALILKHFDLGVPDAPKAKPAAPPAPEKPEATPEAMGENAEPAQEQAEKSAAETAPPQKAAAEKEAASPGPPKPPEKDATGAGGGGGNGDGKGGGSGIPPQPPRDPLLGRGTIFLIATLGVIFLILIAASIVNNQRYFIKDTRQGIEILQGDFSPTGKYKIAAIPGAEAPEDTKDFYDRTAAFTIAYEHYIKNAQEFMEKDEEASDLKGIRTNLEKAGKFALTEAQKQEVADRLKQVDFALFIFRAEIAAQRQTMEGYESALDFLNRAADLDVDSPAKIEMLDKKIEKAKERLKTLIQEKEPEVEEAETGQFPDE